jgi:NAD(P)H dehydrogenase (quinone)
MPKLLVVFYSRTGNTARLADAIVEGARSVRFAEVDARRLEDLAPEETVAASASWAESREALRGRYRTLASVEELVGYDAIVFGSPGRYGVMAAELKLLFDQCGPLWTRGALVDKVGSAFTTVQTAHGGHETTLWSIMTPMATLGMIVVPPGYTEPAMFAGGSPFGATAMTGRGERGDSIPDADLAAARVQGARVAKVAEWVRHAKSHEAPSHGHHHHH